MSRSTASLCRSTECPSQGLDKARVQVHAATETSGGAARVAAARRSTPPPATASHHSVSSQPWPSSNASPSLSASHRSRRHRRLQVPTSPLGETRYAVQILLVSTSETAQAIARCIWLSTGMLSTYVNGGWQPEGCRGVGDDGMRDGLNARPQLALHDQRNEQDGHSPTRTERP